MRAAPSLVLIAGALLVAFGTALSRPEAASAGKRELQLLNQIERYQAETRRWERLMLRPRTPVGVSARQSQSAEYRRWVLRLWKLRAARARQLAATPPLLRAWLCIHRHEARRWSANTGNGYYGGLQMDLTFQLSYAPGLLRQKGTADRWTPLEQIWVAVRAHRSGRGFHPWPRTARACGLI